MKITHSQCRCGAIRLRLAGEPVVQLYCHCDDCRAAHDAAYVSSVIYPSQAVEIVGERPVAMTVKRTPRMRCTACGTHLFSELASVGVRSVNAFLLPKEAFKPQFHVQCQHAILPIVDDLPHYKGFPPSFGGTDEFIGW